MNRLYSIAFKRILASLNAQEITPANVDTTLQDNKVKPAGSYVYHRLARQQLKNFVKTPCPVQNTDSEHSQAIIKASKSLRASFSVQEEKVCNRCPHKTTCPHFAKPGFENNINAVSDLLVFMQGMNEKANLSQDIDLRVWTSGYKACDGILAAMEDLKRESPQTLQYEKIRLKHATEAQEARAKARAVQEQFAPPAEAQQKPKKKKKEKKVQQQLDETYEVEEKVKPRRIQKTGGAFAQEDDEFKTDDIFDTEVKRQRRERDKQHRLSKSEIPKTPRNPDLRKRQPDYFERNSSAPAYRQEPFREPKPKEPRQYSNYRGPNTDRRSQSTSADRRQYEQDYRPNSQRRDEPSQNRRQRYDQNKRQHGYDYNDRVSQPNTTRAQELYQQRKNHKKTLDKVKQQEINLDQRFQQTGKLYKKTKVMEEFDPVEHAGDGFRGSRPMEVTRKERKAPLAEPKGQQKARVQEETSKAEPEVRRGRKIRK